MVEIISRPDEYSLLPPLLACLPTAFASSRPPPALLPLLSPILRQRLEIITSTSSSNDNWIGLLSWDDGKAESLKEIVENAHFEPHPASGELEVGEADPVSYKRFDEETLRAKIPLPDWSLTAVYLWCSSAEENSSWKLAELLPYEGGGEDAASWSATVAEAGKNWKGRRPAEATRDVHTVQTLAPPSMPDDDGDYWAQYDKSGGITPARKNSQIPNGSHASDADHYAQYGAVQPALDGDDPSEKTEEMGQSTLNGNALSTILGRQPGEQNNSDNLPHHPSYDGSWARQDVEAMRVDQPRPASSSAHGSDRVARLEETAERYAALETGIRQHIGTNMKSMFRLAKSAGMDREEFERIILRELEALSIFDGDD